MTVPAHGAAESRILPFTRDALLVYGETHCATIEHMRQG